MNDRSKSLLSLSKDRGRGKKNPGVMRTGANVTVMKRKKFEAAIILIRAYCFGFVSWVSDRKTGLKKKRKLTE